MTKHIHEVKRVEWDQYDLDFSGVRVEVKSAAHVQSWPQARPSVIEFGIRPTVGWDSRTNTYAPSPMRSADVYVFCLLNGEDREKIDPLDVQQWTFYVLPTSELNRNVPEQKKIRLGPLRALNPRECTFGELKAAVQAAAEINGTSSGCCSPD